MAASRVIRNSRSTCVVICRRCGQQITVRLERMRQRRTLPVMCGCGRELRLVRERRGEARQAVELLGALLDVTTHAFLTSVTITDLSLKGVGFESPQRVIEVEHLYRLNFRLDDAEQTEIEEDIVVGNVQDGQRVGAAFLYQGGYNFELDFYLAPWSAQS